MKLGVCGLGDRMKAAAAAGIDYMEMQLNRLHGKSPDELAELRRQAQAYGLSIDALNNFFPKEICLYGGAEKEKELLAYAAENFRIASVLGAGVLIVGNGKARAVPPGMEKEEAEARFARLVGKLGDMAGDCGMLVAVEPLSRTETDLVNTLSDGVRLKRMTGSANVGCMVDLYHFYLNGENVGELKKLCPGELVHAHLARPDADRGIPREEDGRILREWARALRSIGYDRRISLECRFPVSFDEEIAAAAREMRRDFL